MSPDGRIALVDAASPGRGLIVSMFLPSGAKDTSFDLDGVIWLNGKLPDQASAKGINGAVFDDAGGLLLSTQLKRLGSTDLEPAILRIGAAGALDRAFGIGGVATTPHNITGRTARSLSSVAELSVDARGDIFLLTAAPRGDDHGPGADPFDHSRPYAAKFTADGKFSGYGQTSTFQQPRAQKALLFDDPAKSPFVPAGEHLEVTFGADGRLTLSSSHVVATLAAVGPKAEDAKVADPAPAAARADKEKEKTASRKARTPAGPPALNVRTASKLQSAAAAPQQAPPPPGTAQLRGNQVFVTGTDAAEDIQILRLRSRVLVSIGDNHFGFDRRSVKRIIVNAGGGDDAVIISTGVPACYVFGGDGNDRISGGDACDTLSGGAGNDTIEGNGGDDRISGGGGRDLLRGGAGNDRIFGDDGNDVLDGGDGDDTIDGGDGENHLQGGTGQNIIAAAPESRASASRNQVLLDAFVGGLSAEAALPEFLDIHAAAAAMFR